jgi:hypothetical protein
MLDTARDLADSTLEPIKFSARNYKYGFETFQQQPYCTKSTGYGLPTGATGDTNLMRTGTYPSVITSEYYILGAGQTILAPVIGANGLGVELDKTDDEGAEYVFGGSTARGKFAFTVGTDPTFFARLKFKQSDVSGTDFCVLGLRIVQAFNPDPTAYTDYALIGQLAATGAISVKTRKDSGTATATATSDTAWADTITHQYAVEVQQSGAVRFFYDATVGTLLPVTLTNTFSFNVDDVVIPFFRYLHAAASPQDVDFVEFECGYRPVRT